MSIYDFTYKTPAGKEISMEEYRDRPILIINTATKCALTPQFEGLEDLHQEYKDEGLVVLGFPCNQFLNQEPISNDEMEATCKINFGVTFPLSEKVKVNGPDAHPLFVYLKEHLGGGLLGSDIKWNFTKFLIDTEGQPYKRYSPTTNPAKIEKGIKKVLKQSVTS